MVKLTFEMEKGILVALYRYYIEDVTFEKSAEDAGIPIYFLIEYVSDHKLPMIHTEKDVSEGIRKVFELMKKRGIDVKKLL